MVIDYLKYLLSSAAVKQSLTETEGQLLSLVKKPERTINDRDILGRLKMLKAATGSIEVNDFGAGSKATKKPSRKIRTIAKYASIQPKYGQLYGAIIKCFKMEQAIELGTSFGIGTSYLAKAAQSVTTLEGCKNTAAIAATTFSSLGCDNIIQKTGEFSTLLTDPLIKSKKPQLVYLDGNHQKGPTLAYFEFFRTRLPENSVLIFDDIYWSREMKEAWSYICQQPYFTIDLYQVGILLLTEKNHPLAIRGRY